MREHREDHDPTDPPVELTRLDRTFAASTGVFALATLVGTFVAPSWQIGLATVLLALIPWCVLTALRRRRRAEPLALTGSAPDARRAATLHFQEAGLVLLAVGLLLAAAGALSLRG